MPSLSLFLTQVSWPLGFGDKEWYYLDKQGVSIDSQEDRLLLFRILSSGPLGIASRYRARQKPPEL
jgi:hypothetical protein